MRKYELMATQFVVKIKDSKAKTSSVFKIDKYGKRIINKRTKAYKLVNNEIENLLSNYTKSTAKNIIVSYNKILDSNNLHIYKDIIRFIFTPQYKTINKAYKERLSKRTNNAIFIKNGQDLINLAYSYIQSYDYKKISVGLAILTGRRTSEILKTAKFTKVDKSHIYFEGQLKHESSEGYVIPVLGNSSEIIKALENLRIIKHYKSIESVNENASGELNRFIKKHLSKWNKSLKMHDLRRFYNYVCYHHVFTSEAKQNERQTFEGFTMKILGHQNIGSGQSYRVLEVEM